MQFDHVVPEPFIVIPAFLDSVDVEHEPVSPFVSSFDFVFSFRSGEKQRRYFGATTAPQKS